MTRVGLVRSRSRREGVAAALAHVADQVDLGGVNCVLIKPNFVSTRDQLAATHVDAVRAVLDFVRARYDGRVVVGEGAALSSTGEGFRNFGYEALVDAYGAELLDLNADAVVEMQVRDRRLRPLAVRLARTALEADYRISLAMPKTHDVVIATLSIKNMVMGALVNPRAVGKETSMPIGARQMARLVPKVVWRSGLAEWAKRTLLGRLGGSSKMAMHQGFPAINLNIALVAPRVWPRLAVIDGWQGMEGEGPGAGDPVDWQVALAGTDPLAVDVLTAQLMGFDPEQIGYLQHCRRVGLGEGDLARIETVGDVAPDEVRRSFVPHPAHQSQLAWRLDGVARYLGTDA